MSQLQNQALFFGTLRNFATSRSCKIGASSSHPDPGLFDPADVLYCSGNAVTLRKDFVLFGEKISWPLSGVLVFHESIACDSAILSILISDSININIHTYCVHSLTRQKEIYINTDVSDSESDEDKIAEDDDLVMNVHPYVWTAEEEATRELFTYAGDSGTKVQVSEAENILEYRERSNRKEFPSSVKLAKLKKGEMSAAFRGKQMVMKWKDKRDVIMMSTFHGLEMSRVEKRGKVQMKPHMAVLNTFSLYKINEGKFSRKELVIMLGEKLIEKYRREHNMVIGRPSKSPQPTRLTEKHFPDFVPPMKKKSPTRRCVVCCKTGA
ncbi:hypothetical protein J437_LFUL007751 [Ladona fulva]|uniref:PiggyBac transposable element-derived protein domain-containing protein n=1 Tax=Ladona fulva TaxID=123851 RepID=A0A8K0P844_LADFU|nr:hypothetical protein J437_LFUL007751 [Ladona fulva]